MSTFPHLIGTAEAARRLDCSTRTVHRLVAAGKLTPALHAPGANHGVFLFDVDDIEAYRAAHIKEAS